MNFPKLFRLSLLALSLAPFCSFSARAADSKAKIFSAPTSEIASSGRFVHPRSLTPSGATTLYDQTTDSYQPGLPVYTFANTNNPGLSVAEDFTVSDSSGWSISGFNFAVHFDNSDTSGIVSYNVYVYGDTDGKPSDVPFCSARKVPGVLDAANTALSIAMPSVCPLPPGHYWVAMQPNMDTLISTSQSWWSAWSPAQTPGSVALWRAGLDFGPGCAVWQPSNQLGCGITEDLAVTSFGFQILGTVGGGSGTIGDCATAGICLDVTVAPASMDGPAACGSETTVSVNVGDQVNYCYTVANNSGTTLQYQSLSDNIDGTVLSLSNRPIPSGTSYQYNRIVTVGADETRNATWAAQDSLPGYLATQTLGVSDRVFCDGFEGESCSGNGGFVDIRSVGTELPVLSDPTGAFSGLIMPFSFNFYGTTSNNLCVGNDGILLFGLSDCPTFIPNFYDNFPLPNSLLPASAIAPLWDRFDEPGKVYYATLGTAPNRRFVVGWFDKPGYGSTNLERTATFEVIFDEAGSTLSFEYLSTDYESFDFELSAPVDATSGIRATVGVQKDRQSYRTYSYNQAAVPSHSGIRWAPTAPSQRYTASATVTVDAGAPVIAVDPSSLSGSVAVGGTSTLPLTIRNTGDRELSWNLREGPAAKAHFPSGSRYVAAPDPLREVPYADAPSVIDPAGSSRADFKAYPSGGLPLVPAYAMRRSNEGVADYVRFNANVPGTLTAVGPMSEEVYNVAFINNDFSKAYGVSASKQFGTLDTSTGVFSAIGPVSIADPRALAWDHTRRTLYGIGAVERGPSSLYTIDPSNGAYTLVGQISGIGFETLNYVFGLAVDPNSGLMYGIEAFTGSLVAIDKTTAAATTIGPLGYPTAYAQGLNFDPETGKLYLSSTDTQDGNAQNLYTVNLSTGAATLVGSYGRDVLQIAGFAIAVAATPCTPPADVPWLSFDVSNGSTAAGGQSLVNVGVNASGLAAGRHSANVCISSNDPSNRAVVVPVQVDVM